MGVPGDVQQDAGGAVVADDATEPPAATGPREIAEAVALLRDHPRWAVWLPGEDGEWVAVRSASSRPPAPEVPLIWVRAVTAAELASRMDRADAALSPG
jgi:hypothetical protein